MTSRKYSADIDWLWCSWLDIADVCDRNMSGLLGIMFSSDQLWIILCVHMSGFRLPPHHVIPCHFLCNEKCKCTFMNAALDGGPM